MKNISVHALAGLLPNSCHPIIATRMALPEAPAQCTAQTEIRTDHPVELSVPVQRASLLLLRTCKVYSMLP